MEFCTATSSRPTSCACVDGSVKIMDFGISRLLGDVDTRLTQAGFLMGTPQYMAPEQLTGQGEADVLCDIWAYGVVLYEFLTSVQSLQRASRRTGLLSPDHGRAPAALELSSRCAGALGGCS